LNHLATEFAPKPKLEYPFQPRWAPQHGQPFEVAEGVFWLRVPLPIVLDHINLWLLRDGDGWTIVDSGYDAPICKETWEQVFDGFLTPSEVKRVIVTHFHPDHIGLASWLALRCDCAVWISRGEFGLYNKMLRRDEAQFDAEASLYLQQLGFDTETRVTLKKFFVRDEKPEEARVQEAMCRFIGEDDDIKVGNRLWKVVTGRGHSPEHACLYCEELSVLISGDQSIPRISSNVSVFPSNRNADPLGDWLASCEKLRDDIPNNTLILPSHQEPFIGNVQRMQQLIDDHNAQLNRLRLALAETMSVVQARDHLFQRELNTADQLFAAGETLAHLNYLLHRKEISVELDGDGVEQYSII